MHRAGLGLKLELAGEMSLGNALDLGLGPPFPYGRLRLGLGLGLGEPNSTPGSTHTVIVIMHHITSSQESLAGVSQRIGLANALG